MGGPGYRIPGEFAGNGFANELQHERGVVSMARAAHPDSAGSQFFIMVADAPHLDGQYAAFGRVVSGIEVADAIVGVPRSSTDRPLTEQRMSVTVETFGAEYPEPEIISHPQINGEKLLTLIVIITIIEAEHEIASY